MTNCENEEFFKKCLDILSQIKYFVTTEKELQLLEKLKEIVESKQLHEELNEDYKKNAERIIIDLNEIFNNEYRCISFSQRYAEICKTVSEIFHKEFDRWKLMLDQKKLDLEKSLKTYEKTLAKNTLLFLSINEEKKFDCSDAFSEKLPDLDGKELFFLDYLETLLNRELHKVFVQNIPPTDLDIFNVIIQQHIDLI